MAQQVKTKATFPSVEWFEALKEIINADDGYKRFGTCDASVGIKVPEAGKYFVITFEAFEVGDVKETDERAAEDTDFWIEQTYDQWQEMITNIADNGKADLGHTLNTLDVEYPDGLARSNDGYRRDLFYRFNQSFQHFFDATSQIETKFAK
ncbi:MAG: hypothetical protein IIB85_00555 [Chloroflexi bacterium]|nr:hypothetical protein [Chloroflexota bacterium]